MISEATIDPEQRFVSFFWHKPPAIPPLRDGLQLWRIDVASLRPRLHALSTCLSAEEVRHAGQFRYAVDRECFLARRAALRVLLGGLTETAPAAIEYVKSTFGKPSVANARVQFNISRSQDVAVVSIASKVVHGVDVEAERPIAEALEIAAYCFSPSEREWLRALPNDARSLAFLHLWTAKESVLKATGHGLSLPLDTFAIVPVCRGTASLLSADRSWAAEPIIIRSVKTHDHFLCAVATLGAAPAIEAYEFDYHLV